MPSLGNPGLLSAEVILPTAFGVVVIDEIDPVSVPIKAVTGSVVELSGDGGGMPLLGIFSGSMGAGDELSMIFELVDADETAGSRMSMVDDAEIEAEGTSICSVIDGLDEPPLLPGVLVLATIFVALEACELVGDSGRRSDGEDWPEDGVRTTLSPDGGVTGPPNGGQAVTVAPGNEDDAEVLGPIAVEIVANEVGVCVLASRGGSAAGAVAVRDDAVETGMLKPEDEDRSAGLVLIVAGIVADDAEVCVIGSGGWFTAVVVRVTWDVEVLVVVSSKLVPPLVVEGCETGRGGGISAVAVVVAEDIEGLSLKPQLLLLDVVRGGNTI